MFLVASSSSFMPKLSLAKLERHLYGAADRPRQEGLDAATYKGYIFEMLFLTRCSHVIDAERHHAKNATSSKTVIQDRTTE